MRQARLIDPAHRHTPESIARCGTAFELTTGTGTGVFVVQKRDSQLWIHGAGAVASKGGTVAGLDVVEQMAEQTGCTSIAFQTGRPGLVRIAKKHGYKITGFIMEKTK